MSFLVVGEALVDLINRDGSWTFHAVPGGSPLNVAVGLAAAGCPVRLASECGDDLFGDLLDQHLRRHRLATGDLARGAAPTSLAFARVGADGVARYDFRLTWELAGEVALDGVGCLHTGSLATAVEPGAGRVRALVAAARAAGVPVSYDPNVRPSILGDRAGAVAGVEEMVGRATIVKVSDEDLGWLYPGAEALAVGAAWAARGPRLVVVTRGAAGAVGWYRGAMIRCAAPAVTVADTVGAGDMFTAGLLAGLWTDAGRADAGPADTERADTERADAGPADTGRADTERAGPPSGAPVVPPRWSTQTVVRALRTATATAAAVCQLRGAGPPAPADVAALLPATVITG